ncbi:MAG: Ig domain protein group 2 domain protein [Bryobacterales bacterium]|nr:Ig domain protein group 2 domain protein [Bryobacterales bacterium]
MCLPRLIGSLVFALLLPHAVVLAQGDGVPPPLTFATQPNGLASLNFQGTEYNFTAYTGSTLVPFAKLAGNGTGYVPTCARSAIGPVVTQNCTFNGGTSFSVIVTYSTPDPYTLNASIVATNTDPSTPVGQLQITTLGLSILGYDPTTSRMFAVDATNPIAYANFGAGQVAIWNAAPNPVVPLGTTDTTLNMNCSGTACPTLIVINNLAPGQSKTASFNLRFTADPAIRPVLLAPEAYGAFAAAYPSILSYPDRRPVMAWFMSDHAKVSATNPRGYLQDPSIDVSDVAGFAARVLNKADAIIREIQARPIQPQGITIWDLEGQEFVQPTSYIGDPRIFGLGYAPEMDAVADRLFNKFKDAGYKVGITLRPQQLQWVSSLPSTCAYDPAGDYNQYDIVVGARAGQKFYKCNSDGLSFTLVPGGNGFQTSYRPTDPASVTALLMSKVAYAYARWHTTFYYVDSTVWVGGAPMPADIFRQLQIAFPDCIFVPEESYAATAGVALPFQAPAAGNPTITPLSWRYDYPTANTVQFLSNCQVSCWAKNFVNYTAGQRIGDIALYGIPSQLGPGQPEIIEAMIFAARAASSSVIVTDTTDGSVYSYSGVADSIYTYPVKMRVYFADTDDNLPSSTTYCENGQWQGENTCSLNLAGLVRAQIRYYDFSNNLVVTGSPQAR